MVKFLMADARIIKINQLNDTIFDFTIENEELAKKAQCGQFIHIDCGDNFTLRRPISICEIGEISLRFIFDVRGKGTSALSEKKIGDTMNVLGPLGNTFGLTNKKALVLGGGIGIYPLLELSKQINPDTISFGFRNKDLITLENEFELLTKNLVIATDDGSCGFHGNALSAVLDRINKGDFEVVYACGPLPMIKAIKEITDKLDIECQISLEERMGCGIGACLCCPVKISDDTEMGFKHLHVCKNGPIFNAKEVIL